jgi:hypothetical protein
VTRISDGGEDIGKKESDVELEDYGAPRPGGAAGTSSMLLLSTHDDARIRFSESGTLSAIRCTWRGSRTEAPI